MIRDDNARNPLRNDFVIDTDDESGFGNLDRDSDHANSFECFTRAMVNVRTRKFPKKVVQADTIVVSCGLRRHAFWRSYEELDTGADYEKFLRSFEDNYPEIWNGRSLWTIQSRKFDNPDCNTSIRKHIAQLLKLRCLCPNAPRGVGTTPAWRPNHVSVRCRVAVKIPKAAAKGALGPRLESGYL